MEALTTEFRVTGPPGTGKTTFLARQVESDVARYGEERIVIASLTRAAAAEIGARVDLPRQQVGTLHSLCFHLLGKPELTEKHLKEWNESHPDDVLSTEKTGSIDEPDADARGETGETEADRLRGRYDLYRAREYPREFWPSDVEYFAGIWEDWKRREYLMDFTDLIVQAGAYEHAPGAPSVLMVDECQDQSKIEMRLIRQWGQHVERLYVVGDPDQAIFTWRGADPSVFQYPPAPAERRRVLSQSYRVPEAVHAQAMEWIRQIDDRDDVRYEPRPAPGFVEHSRATFKRPEEVADQIEECIVAGASAMALASCGYMLYPLIKVLRDRAIPFHNPYRRINGRWNPLSRSSERKTGLVDRLLAFLRPDPQVWGESAREWNAHDLKLWAHLLRAEGVFLRGAKTQVAALEDRQRLTSEMLAGWFEPEALLALWRLSVPWFADHMLTKPRETAEYTLCVLEERGAVALMEPPKVTVGTIHSVKGGQSDVVFLFPDLSQQGAENYHTPGDGFDAVVRLFYVALTRAHEGVVHCAPSGFGAAVNW